MIVSGSTGWLPSKRPSDLRVLPTLNDDVRHLASVIDGAPRIHPLSANAADHLIQMPSPLATTVADGPTRAFGAVRRLLMTAPTAGFEEHLENEAR